MALAAVLEQFDVKCQVFDKFIGEFTLNETTYVMCHGKDNKDMFKNLPLTLDVKTENFINEYLDNKGITGNVVFVKEIYISQPLLMVEDLPISQLVHYLEVPNGFTRILEIHLHVVIIVL